MAKTDETTPAYVIEALQLIHGNRIKAETVVTGYTQTPDELVKLYGIICAVIWGKIFRYCQMEEEVCRAAQERIANELGVSRPTVNKYISLLVENGYLKDRTPDIKNKPHIYTDTGKIRLKNFSSMSDSTISSNSTVKNFYSDGKNFLHEESTTNSRNAFSIYEANIGALTPIIADKIEDFVKTYSLDWFEECVALAVHYNKRNLAYMETIAQRWQKEGKDDGKGGKPTDTQEAYNEALRKAGYDV